MDLLIEGIENGWVEKTELTRKLTLAGKTMAYPVYRVRLDKLYYNDQNDRISTWIEEYCLEHGIDKLTCNEEDMESYNSIIETFIEESNREKLVQTRNNIAMFCQREAGISLADGRVVDGNRRFTCLRQLHRENLHNENFAFFETVILPENIQKDMKHIKMLELMVQHGEESRVDYDPINRLAGLYNDLVRNKLLTVKEYAQSINQQESDVQKDLELAEFLAEYLDSIQMPLQFHIARKNKLDGPIREIFSVIRAEKDEDMKADMKEVAFTQLTLMPHTDMTRYMRNIKRILKDKRQAKNFIEEQLDIAEKLTDEISDSKMVSDGKVMETLESLKAESDLAKQASRCTEVFDNRVRATADRERAAHVIEKAIDSIRELDQRIFPKLSEELRTTIVEDADELIELLGEIKEAAGVHRSDA